MYRKIASFLSAGFDNIEGTQVHRFRRVLEKSQWFKREQLQSLQLKKLRALLKYAYDMVPYYHSSFSRVKFKPQELTCLEDLQKVPILEKTVFRNASSEMLAKNFQNLRPTLWKTSGTTSSPIQFFRCKNDTSWALAAELRGFGWAGYETGDKMGRIWRLKPEEMSSPGFWLKQLLKRIKILNVEGLSESSMLHYARQLQRFKPSYIRGYAASTNVFATFLSKNKELKMRVKAVFTTGQTLPAHYRRNIEEAFGCPVYDCYSSNEMGQIALECGNHEGHHISEENILLEIVRDEEHASAGEEGKVLVTNLNNYAMPFIRYDIGDLGKILRDECSCGRKLSLIKPQGRHYEMFASSGGRFTVLRDAEYILQELPIQDFQIVQKNLKEIVIRIARKPGYTPAHTAFIIENLKAHGPARIEVEFVDSIIPEKTGKTKQYISKIKTEYT